MRHTVNDQSMSLQLTVLNEAGGGRPSSPLPAACAASYAVLRVTAEVDEVSLRRKSTEKADSVGLVASNRE